MGLETAQVASMASSGANLAGAGMSFAQMAEQKRLMREAEKRAEEAISKSRDLLSTNYLSGLSIAKEPYELEREAMMLAAAQGIDAARESDRGIGIIPAIYQQAQLGQQANTARMAKDIQDMNLFAAREDASLARALSDTYLEETRGAQLAAAYADNAYNQAQGQMAGQMSGALKDMITTIPQKYNLDDDSVGGQSRWRGGSTRGVTQDVNSVQPQRFTQDIDSISGQSNQINLSGSSTLIDPFFDNGLYTIDNNG